MTCGPVAGGRDTGSEVRPGDQGGIDLVIEKIVSGGQTGADRAALEVALELGIATGGWVPRGRLAEDGTVPKRYEGLVEAESDSYDERTERNVRDSDATIIFAFGPPIGGSALTRRLARSHEKPLLSLDLERCTSDEAIAMVRKWLTEVRPRVLNVAGPRLSNEPRIAGATAQILGAAIRLASRTG